MVNNDYKLYSYSALGTNDEYGQEVLSEPIGTIKMAIYLNNQAVNGSVLYSGAEYIGLTKSKEINDTWVIHNGADKLKVLYVNTQGKLTQVAMVRL